MTRPSTLRLACAALAAAVLASCTTTPPRFTLPKGEPLAITVRAAPPGNGPIPISNQAMGNNVGAGATTGGLSGGLLGLGCGPLALVCVPVLLSLGALTGSAAGALAGATGSLSSAQADQVRDRLAQVRQSRDLVGELRQQLSAGAGTHGRVTADAPASTLNVELREFWLGSTRDERIGYVMSVAVLVSPAAGAAQTQAAAAAPDVGSQAAPTAASARAPAPRIYEYVSPLTPLPVWLDAQAGFLDASFSAALQQLSMQIVMDLMPG